MSAIDRIVRQHAEQQAAVRRLRRNSRLLLIATACGVAMVVLQILIWLK